MDPKAIILKNRGVLLDMAAVVQDELGRWSRVVTDEATGEPKVEQVRVRFDANVLADIEEKYGSVATFQETMKEQTNSAIRKAVALSTERDEKAVGAAMLPEKVGTYLLDVQIALAVAMGMDPTQGVRSLEEGHRAIKRAEEEARAKMDANLHEVAVLAAAEEDLTSPSLSPGTSGTAPGSQPKETPSSSGG